MKFSLERLFKNDSGRYVPIIYIYIYIYIYFFFFFLI